MHGGDAGKSLAAVSSVGSMRNQLRQIADSDVQASLACVSGARAGDADPGATHAPSVGQATSAGVRFRILRPHAKGGLGQVSVASDDELHREVALKEIQDRHADDPNSRSRFVLEAEITGGLEHPGIVPVYGLGQYADGRPYYAMRFIRGDSLKDAIERFHEAEGQKRDPGERALDLRQLLGRFVDVCNAIAYAHSRGVLHRDLKPGNIMLGQYGETLVVDWGLAKAQGRPDIATSAEGLLKPASVAGSAPTQMGSAIGTPQYMSPEQASGRLDQLGPPSDVYSLGATLYCLLTAQPPCTDTDVGVLLKKVQKGDFPSPRQVKATVPPALEAICLKALALQPQHRYGAPRALADDVEHWLADEPVGAYREPWTARAGRWARRHRTGVTAAVAALLVAVVGLLTATVLLGAANDRERSAKELAQKNEEEANKQRDKAHERFKQARAAVDKFDTQVSESPEMKAQGVEGLRTKLLETAAAFYQQFVQDEEGNDAEVQAERGRGYIRLGKLYGATGRSAQADEAFLKGLDICRNLNAAHSGAADSRPDLADGLMALGQLYQEDFSKTHDTRRLDLAERHLAEARDVCKELVDSQPLERRYRRLLAESCRLLGKVNRSGSRLDRAEELYHQGIKLMEPLAEAQPKNPEDLLSLSVLLGSLGLIYKDTGRLDAFEKTQKRALAIHQELVAAHPEVPDYRQYVGYAHSDLGNLYRSTNRNELAVQSLRQALAVRRELSADHPAVVKYQFELIEACLDVGDLYRTTGQLAAAVQAHQEALQHSKPLADAYPKVPEYQGELGLSYYNLGLTYTDMQNYDLAEKAYKEALVVRKKLADANPTVAIFQADLANNYLGLGDIYRHTRRLDDAVQTLTEALQLSTPLVDAHPEVPDYKGLVGASFHNLGLTYTDMQSYDLAEKAYKEAIGIRKKLVDANRLPGIGATWRGVITIWVMSRFASARLRKPRKRTRRAWHWAKS